MCATDTALGQQLAFPGAVGYGAYATGGRSGTVYHVTNLNDSGSGSFRDAVSQPNRIVVFDVGGYITLASAVSAADNLTIAGQTAPGDGIGIMGHEVSFTSRTNEIVRYVRFRPGSIASSTEDGINLGDGTNMIFDHISIEYAPYNDIDAHGNYGADHFTFQNSILANPIGQQFVCHSECLGGVVTWYRNIWANAEDRNPMAKMNTVSINNVVYNYVNGYTTANTSGHFTHDIINDYFIAGPSTATPGNDFFQFDSNQSVYATGNLLDSGYNGTLSGAPTAPSGVVILSGPWSFWTTNIPTASTTGGYFSSLSVAGAFSANNNLFYNATNSLYRDQIDAQVLGNVMSLGTIGQLWTSQTQDGLGNNGYGTLNTGYNPVDTDQGGPPDYWQLANGMNPNNPSDNSLGPDGYTRVEEYLNWLGGAHAIALSNSFVNVDLWQYTMGFTNVSPVYSVSNPSNGVVALLGNGHTAQFTPTSGFSGMASFGYYVTASTGDAMTDTVSVVVTGMTPPPIPPAAPSGLTATAAGSTGINLGWVNNATNATNVLLQRSTDNVSFTQIASLGASVTNYSDTGLTPATTYYYRVQATNTGGNSVYSNTAQATTASIPAVTWVGDGVSNRWDVGVTTNWFNGTSMTVFSNAAAVTFGSSGSTTPPVFVVGSPQPLSVTVNASVNYTFAGGGSVSGTMALVKSGSGQLTLSSNNAYSGGTTLNAGTLTLNSVRSAGSGTITLNGGTLFLGTGVSNNLNVTASSTLVATNGDALGGTITGSNTLNLAILNGNFTIDNTISGFSGTFELGASAGTLRFYVPTSFATCGSSNAVFDLGTNSATLAHRMGDMTFEVGALMGGPNTVVSGATVGGSNLGATTYVIGGLNLNTVFSGTITQQAARTTSYAAALTKVGTGTLTLTGTNMPGISGGVTVSGGTLLVDGLQGMLSNSTLTVATNALLGGNGTIFGRVTVNAGGGITPGDGSNAVGTLTMSNLTLNTPTMYFDLSSSTNGPNDQITLLGGLLTMSGTQTYNFNLIRVEYSTRARTR
jgi:autotransporter-associated beta strand protein